MVATFPQRTYGAAWPYHGAGFAAPREGAAAVHPPRRLGRLRCGQPVVGRRRLKNPSAVDIVNGATAALTPRLSKCCRSPLSRRGTVRKHCPSLRNVRVTATVAAPFRPSLRQAWRRSPAGRYLRRRHPRLRAPRLGDQRALARPRPPGVPPPRSGSAPAGARYSRQQGADHAGTDLTVNIVHCTVNNVARN